MLPARICPACSWQSLSYGNRLQDRSAVGALSWSPALLEQGSRSLLHELSVWSHGMECVWTIVKRQLEAIADAWCVESFSAVPSPVGKQAIHAPTIQAWTDCPVYKPRWEKYRGLLLPWNKDVWPWLENIVRKSLRCFRDHTSLISQVNTESILHFRS